MTGGHIGVAAAALEAAKKEGPLDLEPRRILEEVVGIIDRVPTQQHPVGFLCLELTELVALRSHQRLRLHIWTEATVSRTDGVAIHDHVWSGKSFVVAGCLANTIMWPAWDQSGPYTVSEVSYERDGQRAMVVDKGVELVQMQPSVVAKGSWYLLPPRVIHATDVRAFPTATLLLASATESGRPRLVSSHVPDPGVRSRPVVSAEEALAAVDRVLASI